MAVPILGSGALLRAVSAKETPSGSVVQDPFHRKRLSLFGEPHEELFRYEEEVR